MEKKFVRSLTIRYACLQGLYWMVFCSLYSFASVFLLAQDFANREIGILLAAANISAVFLQPFLGSLADRVKRFPLKKMIALVAGGSVLAVICILLFSFSLILIGFFYIVALILMLTLQPLVNSLIFEYINEGFPINYGMARGVGSLTFAIMSSLLGQFIQRFGTNAILHVCLIVFLALIVLVLTFPKIAKTTSSSYDAAKTAADKQNKNEGIGTFFKRYPNLLILLFGFVAVYTFHTFINTYLVQIMTFLGGNDSDFGRSLTIAALCELPAMLGFGYLVKKMSSGKWLRVSGIFYVIRSFLFLMATSVWMVQGSQFLQMVSFALFTPASVYYMNQIMEDKDRVKGQTYMAGATTLGSVFGSMAGGWLLDAAGVHGMLIFGSMAAILGCLLIFYGTRYDSNKI